MVMIAQMKDKRKLRDKIHHAICAMYEEVSTNPLKSFHFPIGEKAAALVGYPKSLLRRLPTLAAESFAGVGYHFKTNVIKKGDFVLDIGSGSGTDLLIASLLVGKRGKVVGVDITDAMIAKAKKAAKRNGFSNVFILKADAENLPIEDNSVDVVISNGVINLIPDKKKVFQEIYRVLKVGGILSIADIVLGNPISKESREDPMLWAECIVGASLENGYISLIRNVGFGEVKVRERLDYFTNSNSENTRKVADEYKAHAIIVKAKKGGEKNGKYFEKESKPTR